MIKKMVKKYNIHILFILILIVLIEGTIIFHNFELENKHKELISSKIVSVVIETMENTSSIQNYLNKAKEDLEISNKTLEQIAEWYDEMFTYANDIHNIYNIYKKVDDDNYSLSDANYFTRMSHVIEDILEAEYNNDKNIYDNTDINKYKEQFDKIYEFNSQFIETMIQKNAVLYANEGYWPDKKNNNEVFLEDFFYWDLYNDFFELLHVKEF